MEEIKKNIEDLKKQQIQVAAQLNYISGAIQALEDLLKPKAGEEVKQEVMNG